MTRFKPGDIVKADDAGHPLDILLIIEPIESHKKNRYSVLVLAHRGRSAPYFYFWRDLPFLNAKLLARVVPEKKATDEQQKV